MPNLKWERPLTIAYWPTSKPLKALIKYLHSIFKMESRVRNHNLDKKLSTHFKALLSLILNVLIGILNSLKSFLNYYCKSWKTKVLLSPKLPSSVSLLSLEWLRFILLQKNCNLLLLASIEFFVRLKGKWETYRAYIFSKIRIEQHQNSMEVLFHLKQADHKKTPRLIQTKWRR